MSAKKIIILKIILSLILCALTSCVSNANDPDTVSDILRQYKKNGLTSWWEAVAIYNAGENPADYKGFEELYLSLDGASYVIVADIAIIKGMNSEKFEKYEEYKTNLKNIVENPSDKYTVNYYIFAYLALKCSDINFDEITFLEYLSGAQKSDGGFALSGEVGDVDITAFALHAVKSDEAVKFLEDKITENGAFKDIFSKNENANSTACALSALIGYYGDTQNEIIQKIADGLELFKVKDKKEVGYSYLIDGKIDTLATAQALIALCDLQNKTSVWEKLYSEGINIWNRE